MDILLNNLFRQASRQTDTIALRSASDSITYEVLVRDIEHVADQLKAHSLRRLGLFLDNGIDWIVIDLACALAKVTVVPLPWFFSPQQLDHAVRSAQLDSIVSHTDISNLLGVAGTGIDLYAGCSLYISGQPGLKEAPDNSASLADARDHSEAAKLSYTSGTTGTPKGIELGYELIDKVCSSIAGIAAGLNIERHLSLLPYSTLLENICGIYAPLSQGITVFAEPADRLGLSSTLTMDPGRLASTINEVQPSSLILTPRLLKLLCSLSETRLIDIRSLKFVTVGGAHVGTSLLERARNLGIPVYEGYGLTEFGSVAMLNTPQDYRLGSVGKPLPHVRVRCADDGEIIVKTSSGKPTDKNSNKACYEITTGDLGYIDSDGFVYVNGRKKNTIVLSTGRNVSPEWVEGELNSSPVIAQSLVYGEAESRLSALIVAQDHSISHKIIRGVIEASNLRLPAYARIASWHLLVEPFTVANQFLTANGRPRRKQIINKLEHLIEQASFSTHRGIHSSANFNSMQESTTC